jgi:hypothetical protein
MPLGDDVFGSYPALAATRTHAVVAWAQRGERDSKLRVARAAF